MKGIHIVVARPALRCDGAAFGYNPFPGRHIPNDAAMGEEKPHE
jgi:hypothetical protein